MLAATIGRGREGMLSASLLPSRARKVFERGPPDIETHSLPSMIIFTYHPTMYPDTGLLVIIIIDSLAQLADTE